MKKVSIVVGHEAKAQGALAVKPLDLTEYVYNTELSKFIVAHLSDTFDVVVHFRDRDFNLGLFNLYEEIEKWQPDYNIELHFNAHENPVARGTETLCVDRWKKHAEIMQKAMCKALGRKGKYDRGVKLLVKGDDGFVACASLQCPSVLIEPFFGSNEDDCGLILERQAELCLAIKAALVVWSKL